MFTCSKICNNVRLVKKKHGWKEICLGWKCWIELHMNIYERGKNVVKKVEGIDIYEGFVYEVTA